MPLPPPDSFPVPEVVAAAREFIRREGEGCVVSIGQLLDELSDSSATGSLRHRICTSSWT